MCSSDLILNYKGNAGPYLGLLDPCNLIFFSTATLVNRFLFAPYLLLFTLLNIFLIFLVSKLPFCSHFFPFKKTFPFPPHYSPTHSLNTPTSSSSNSLPPIALSCEFSQLFSINFLLYIFSVCFLFYWIE